MLRREPLLDGVELAAGLEAFHGPDLPAIDLNGEHGTRFDRHVVEQYGAGPAVGRIASDVRSRHPERVPEEVDQQGPVFDHEVEGHVVDRHVNLVRRAADR